MTQRATTSLSLHYQVKPSQKEGLLVEIKGMLDRCAKEPEFIMGILHETPERRMNSSSMSYGKEHARSSTRPRGRSLTERPVSKTPRNFSTR
jgi:hypothetical protein